MKPEKQLKMLSDILTKCGFLQTGTRIIRLPEYVEHDFENEYKCTCPRTRTRLPMFLHSETRMVYENHLFLVCAELSASGVFSSQTRTITRGRRRRR